MSLLQSHIEHCCHLGIGDGDIKESCRKNLSLADDMCFAVTPPYIRPHDRRVKLVSRSGLNSVKMEPCPCPLLIGRIVQKCPVRDA